MSEWADLHRAAAVGDREARDRLLAPLHKPLRAYVRLRASRALRAAESVSDVVQSVMRELLTDLDKMPLDGERGLYGWALLTARRKIIDKARSLPRRPGIAAPEQPSWSRFDRDAAEAYSRLPSPEAHAVATETQQHLELALRALPERMQRVIVLAKMLELPHEDCGRELGITPGASRILLMRSLARLAKELERQEQGGRRTKP